MLKFDIAGHRKIWFLISALIIIPGLICMAVRGFNFGIDFTGGTIIDLKFNQPVSIAEVRTSLAKYDLDDATIQLSGTQSDVKESENVMIRTRDLEEDQRKEVMATIKSDVGDYKVLREEKVGATIGGELITNAILALVVSWALIILYVAYRFELRFGIAAILALIHDILIVLAVFSLTQRQIDSSFIAALLTIVGYSINDTIVIFDRIRENLKLHFRRGGDINQLVDRSIYQTLTRSLYTVFTVLFTTAALYFFGGDTTKDFAFALLVGFTVGCYSSIFIASPLWVVFRTATTAVSCKRLLLWQSLFYLHNRFALHRSRGRGLYFSFVASLNGPHDAPFILAASPPAAAFCHRSVKKCLFLGPSLRAITALLQVKYSPRP